jgi:hypothetical protein
VPGGRLINTPLTKLQSTAGFIWRTVQHRQARQKLEVMWWEQKGRLWQKLPAVPSASRTPTTKKYAYFVVDDIDLASFPCSAARASARPRKAAAVQAAWPSGSSAEG